MSGPRVTDSRIRLLKFLTIFAVGGTERQVVNLAEILEQGKPVFVTVNRQQHNNSVAHPARLFDFSYPDGCSFTLTCAIIFGYFGK